MTDTQGALEARLRRLEDLDEIRQLFIDYGQLLDRGDYATYAQLFAEEGELMIGPMGRAKGRQEIEAMMGNPYVGMVGHHEDELIREQGRWCFARRKGFVEIPSVMRR